MEKFEQGLGVELYIDCLLPLLCFDGLLRLAVSRGACRNFQPILLESETHARQPVLGQQGNAPNDIIELLAIQFHNSAILFWQDRFVIRELAGEEA